MLEIREVVSGYGGRNVLHRVSLDVAARDIVALICANGAGKTTLLMTICGRPRASGGRIVFEGEDITACPTHELIRRGIAHVPEGRRIFARMSVRENLQMGAFAADPKRFAGDLAFVLSLFPVLEMRLDQYGGTLSGGEQQMLAIGRALMGAPRLLLLDEPSLGLAPLMVRQLFDTIARINAAHGTAILLAEQKARQVLQLAHKAYVLVNGRVTRRGTGPELLADPQIGAAYLGSAGAAVEAAVQP